ncbi:MAG: tRNA pseudouridine(13) synthase TruD, partial [Thermoplasmatota archaeon]
KRAITVQWMSFKTGPENLESLSVKDVEILDKFTSHRSLYIGAHTGNDFEIVVRDLEPSEDEVKDRTDEIGEKIKEHGGFPNWFGVQRFGTIRPITHKIGKMIIDGQFEDAVKLYIANPFEGEDERCYDARERLKNDWEYKEALDYYPHMLTFEKRIIRHISNNPDDYVGALKTLPHNLLMMFVHAYQSYLFNKIICGRINRGHPVDDVLAGDILLPADKDGLPNKNTKVEVTERNLKKASSMVKQCKAYVSATLFGSQSSFSGGEMGEIEREIIEEEGVKKDDFIIPKISSISSRGTRREIFSPVKDLELNVEPGGFNISFGLNKGSYATTLLREFMKLPDDQVDRYS